MTNGDINTQGTVIVTSEEGKGEYNLSNQNNSVLQGVHIKEEPLDAMPPLASPATVINVVTANSATAEKNRELEPSPPATVISLAPAQPYPAGTAQLTFAAPAYDIEGTGQYTVQVRQRVPLFLLFFNLIYCNHC